MAVISGDNNQGILRVGLIRGHFYGFGQFNGIRQSAGRIAGMVGVVNAASLDDQQIAFIIVIKNINGLGSHLTQ